VTAASGTAYTASNVCVYQNPGTYITKVIAQRGNAPAAQAQAQVVVSPAPIPTPVLPPTPTSTPVLIQSVKVSQITPTTAAVTIILNQVASVVINYGPTTAYGSAMQPSPYLSTVYANLTNLTPGTVYDFNVMAMAQGSSAPVTSGNYVFQTQANPIVPTPIPTPSSTASSNYFPRNLKYGDMGSDVKLLNTVLANLTYLSAQNSSSSRFSAATEHALLLFQRAHDINRSGFLDLQSQLLLNKTITANPKLTNGITPTGINFVPPFTQNLKLGSNGSQVTLLQELLREDGEYDFSNRISGYYGVATVVAVKNFQGKYNLVSAQAGVVDSITRTKLNSVYQTIIQK
jgi:peptidoglycan hydrolase-like protein with peptidoglycan-binding domain